MRLFTTGERRSLNKRRNDGGAHQYSDKQYASGGEYIQSRFGKSGRSHVCLQCFKPGAQSNRTKWNATWFVIIGRVTARMAD